MKNLFLFIFIFLLFTLLYSSCGDEPLRMTSDMRTQVDTTYKKQVKLLEVEMDSLCTERFDREVAAARDSIMKERLEERRKKLGY